MKSSKRRLHRTRAFTLALAVFACAAIGLPAASAADGPTTITIAANAPQLQDSCYPFGIGGTDMFMNDWKPFAAFVYKNIPAFELKPADILAFDTSGPQNETNIQLDIALARTTANGNDQNAQPFTTIVTNAQTPANPRGDTTPGNFELQFTAQQGFSFPGGGLIIRFSNPSPAYLGDNTCTINLDAGFAADASGFFLDRPRNDADGVAPWSFTDANSVGEFRLTLKPSNAFSFGKVKRNKHKGTASLAVDVPGPGTLALSGKGVKAQRPARATGATASKAVSAAGTVKLPIKPKTKIKKKLNKHGKAKVKVTVTFTPGGVPAGDPKTQTKRVKLVKKLG